MNSGLGKGGGTKADEFSEELQTAFNKLYRNFYYGYKAFKNWRHHIWLHIYACRFDGQIV